MKIRHSTHHGISVLKSKLRFGPLPIKQSGVVMATPPSERRVRTVRTIVLFLVLCGLMLYVSVHASAQQKDQQQMRGLDEQVQEIKSDVLSIAAELGQLEEKLLYPSDTQVAVFVSLAKGDQMRL